MNPVNCALRVASYLGLGVAMACAVACAREAKPLFDGKTLAGWEGDAKFFRVEDGVIVGGSLNEKMARNVFLATTRSFENFELRLKIKIEGSDGFINSGIQIRSVRVPNSTEMSGYQVDAGE